jgi:hypothetical protein
MSAGRSAGYGKLLCNRVERASYELFRRLTDQ